MLFSFPLFIKICNLQRNVILREEKCHFFLPAHINAENQLEWVGRMNNIRACVREAAGKEIIFI